MNGDGFLLELALVAVLILLNGFFAGAEIAVISARTSRIRPLAERGSRRAASLLRLKAKPDRFLATVQIGVTLVGTLASAVGGVARSTRWRTCAPSCGRPNGKASSRERSFAGPSRSRTAGCGRS